MSQPFLSEPNEQVQESFKNYVLTYKKIGDEHYFNKYKLALVDFKEYLYTLKAGSTMSDSVQSQVYTSTYWLIDQDEVVGVLRIRHQALDHAGHIGYDVGPNYRRKGYGTLLLKLALIKANELGIQEVQISCDIQNVASRKIIEKCGGTFVGTSHDEKENETLYQYIIKL